MLFPCCCIVFVIAYFSYMSMHHLCLGCELLFYDWVIVLGDRVGFAANDIVEALLKGLLGLAPSFIITLLGLRLTLSSIAHLLSLVYACLH